MISDSILYEEYKKINSIEDLLLYLYKQLRGFNLSRNKYINESFHNKDTRENMIRKFLLNSYDNEFIINENNYLDIANSNFRFDPGNNWLYDYSVNQESYSFCKVYFAILKDEYFKTIKTLVNMIEYVKKQNNGLGQCKFRTHPSNDSVILRFREKNAFITFMEILENSDIVNSIASPNLFIPNIGGVSLTTDAGGSYIFIVELLLTNYLYGCINLEKEPTLNEFTRFIENTDFMKVLLIAKMCNYDEDIAYDYKDILIGKINNYDDKKLIKSMFK